MPFAVVLAVAAALLALWVEVRFPGLGPRRGAVLVVHVASSLVVLYAAMPALMRAVLDHGLPAAGPTAAVGVALPALTYALLAMLWSLKVAQRLIAGPLR